MFRSIRVLTSVLATSAILTYSANAVAGDLRGQVMGKSYRGELIPREGVEVELIHEGDSVPISKVISGVNGTFYLYRVPPGTYRLNVNGQHNRDITVRQESFLDLGQVKQ